VLVAAMAVLTVVTAVATFTDARVASSSAPSSSAGIRGQAYLEEYDECASGCTEAGFSNFAASIDSMRLTSDSVYTGRVDSTTNMSTPIYVSGNTPVLVTPTYTAEQRGLDDSLNVYRVESEGSTANSPANLFRVYRNDTLRFETRITWQASGAGWQLASSSAVTYHANGDTVSLVRLVLSDATVSFAALGGTAGTAAERMASFAAGVLTPADAVANCIGPKVAMVGAVVGMIGSAVTANPIGAVASYLGFVGSAIANDNCVHQEEEAAARRAADEARMRELERRIRLLEGP